LFQNIKIVLIFDLSGNLLIMTDKLNSLTHRLYEEGLSKGRAEGERILSEAESRALTIVAEAEDRAREIERKATQDAEDLRKNTMTEIALAGREAVQKIKDEVTGLITTRSIESGVKKAGIDPVFIREILLDVAKNWHGASSEKISLKALLPESKRAHLDKALAESISGLLAEGIEVGYSSDVRTGFRVGEKGGGYYIGFSDDNFEALLSGYLREKVSEILFNKK
jgi:V/A-type H+-transporting ATPase subunit E